MSTAEATPDRRLDALWRARPRRRLLRLSVFALLLLTAAAWATGGFDPADTFSARRGANLSRFLTDVHPHDLGGGAWDWSVVGRWVGRTLAGGGGDAAVETLAISILAVLLAGAAGALLGFAAARTFAVPHPLAGTPLPAPGPVRVLWGCVRLGTRTLLILLRSVPEFILAFLLLNTLGGAVWPAVLALAIHNTGILGRLDAETIENVDPMPLVALRALGARRVQLAAVGIWPAVLPRYLLYFFYRWETCVREATVLGVLGLASLGRLIDDAKVALRYDDMLLLVCLGAAIVLLGDLASALLRRVVRRA